MVITHVAGMEERSLESTEKGELGKGEWWW